ncbi:MAG: sulfatase-like hydrolase/transferase [Gemmataceae bacterium]
MTDRTNETNLESNSTSNPATRKVLSLTICLSLGVVVLCAVITYLFIERNDLQKQLTENQQELLTKQKIAVHQALKTENLLARDVARATQRTERTLAQLNTLKQRLLLEQAKVQRLRDVTGKYATQLPMKYKDCNLVFVSFDALQAGHVGFLGYPRNVTPTIDRIAEQSFAFQHAYSVASWTVPATFSWFTGVYPSEHRMVNKFAVYQPPVKKMAKLKNLAPNLVTLAEIMKQNGYTTAGFTGNAGVSGGFGYETGFDIYYYPKATFGRLDGSVPRAIRWIEQHKEKKFFLFLHGYDVHGQSAPAEWFDYRFVDAGYDKRYTGSPREQERLREEGLQKGKLTLRDQDVRFWRAIYDEKIHRADAHFQTFLTKMDQLGLTKKTLFVLTSDHGTEFYEHRRFDHGFTLYNELLHVPLFIKLPGQTPGRIIPDRVSSIDVLPTILDLLDVEIPTVAQKQFHGKSLAPALRGNPVKRDVFSETDYREYTFKRSIITPTGWKLIYTLEDKTRELYNLATDPGEQNNLVDTEPAEADRLEQKLFAHFQSIGHDLTKKNWKTGLNPVYNSQAKDQTQYHKGK